LNRLILKLFEEEEDLPIYFFVDSSQSMNYGDPSKLDYARRVAAALCYIGLDNFTHFSEPVVAGGKVYVCTWDGKVYAFGLKK